MADELFRDDYPWWTRRDDRALLKIMEITRPKTVLEFGPGVSTATLIDGGAERIDSYEENEEWFDKSKEMLSPFSQVTIRLYVRRYPLFLPEAQPQYDLCFVDGSRWVEERWPEIEYANQHAPMVACHDYEYEAMRHITGELFKDWKSVIVESDPPKELASFLRPDIEVIRGIRNV